MIIPTPTKYFLAHGCAEGMSELNAFDAALMNAGVGDTNLVRMSSILPPRCEEVASIELPPGALVPTAYVSVTSTKPGEVITAAVAIAIPEDEDHPGLIMEHHDHAPSAQVEEQARRMAEAGMAFRGKKIREIRSVAAEHVVRETGAAFAGVILWN